MQKSKQLLCLAVSTLKRKTAQEISFVSTGAEVSLQAMFYLNFRANRCQPSREEVLVTYAKTHSAEMENAQNAWQSLMNDHICFKSREEANQNI